MQNVRNLKAKVKTGNEVSDTEQMTEIVEEIVDAGKGKIDITADNNGDDSDNCICNV